MKNGWYQKETLCFQVWRVSDSHFPLDVILQLRKEIDLRDHGVILQLKYEEPLNPLKGGKVHRNLQDKYLPYPLDLELHSKQRKRKESVLWSSRRPCWSSD